MPVYALIAAVAFSQPPPTAPVIGAGVDKFEASYTAEAFAGPFTGRVVLYIGKGRAEPRFGPNWFNPLPMASVWVKGVRPGERVTIGGPGSAFFPKSDRIQLEPGDYTAQVVFDRNLGGRAIGESPGNVYSKLVPFTKPPEADPRSLRPGTSTVNLALVCDQVVKERRFTETARAQEVRVSSKLLGAFYGRPTNLLAAVALPEAYATEPERRFPVVYEIPGFGGTHYALSGASNPWGTKVADESIIRVILNPECPTGHSAFADSANNGPWGKALTTELIPEIEKKFRTLGKPEGRFLTGHSSGGWSSLWLQVTYPEFFGGVWSTAPDPVDFRAFQTVDIYAPSANFFALADGKPAPIARFGDTPAIFARQFSDMERPIRGEQLGSFEAVFSPRGLDGEPMKLWNRDTGAIDPQVAKAWRKYDIAEILRANWSSLGPKLKGKLHIFAGDKDTFYLDAAVRLLQADLSKLGSDATVEIVPGDHGSMLTASLRNRIDAEIAAAAKKAMQGK